MTDDPNVITRRAFLAGAAGLALPHSTDAGQPNLFGELAKQVRDKSGKMVNQYEFIGQDGKVVNIAALQNMLKNNHVTLAFGFSHCEIFCPTTSMALRQVGDNAKCPLTSIMISVKPEEDGATPQSRAAYMHKLKMEFRVPQNIIILYPSRNGHPAREAAKSMPVLAHSFGANANPDDPVQHAAELMLFKPGGDLVARKNIMGGGFAAWAQQYIVNKGRQP